MSVPCRRKLRGVLQKQAPFMITCRQLEDFIGDYLEGELPFRQRFIFRLHLVYCRECRDYLGTLSVRWVRLGGGAGQASSWPSAFRRRTRLFQ